VGIIGLQGSISRIGQRLRRPPLGVGSSAAAKRKRA